MTATTKCPNETLARRAAQLGRQAKSPITRQAAMVVTVALGMTRTVEWARRVVQVHRPLDDAVRRAALDLMDQLTG